jgi:hypothetical protein
MGSQSDSDGRITLGAVEQLGNCELARAVKNAMRPMRPGRVASASLLLLCAPFLAIPALGRVSLQGDIHQASETATRRAQFTEPVSQVGLSVRSTRNGRGLLLFFIGAAPSKTAAPCSARYHATHTETNRAVHIELAGASVPPATGTGCLDIGYTRHLSVPLRAPLDQRTVTVNTSRQRVFDGARLARPMWVPSGFLMSDEGDPSGTTWTRRWSPPVPPPTDNHCTPTAMGLQLTQGPNTTIRRQALARDLAASDQQLQSQPRIGTAAADYYASVHEQTLTWNEGKQNYTLTTVPPCGRYILTPLLDVLRFARSLQLPAR